MKEDIKAEWVNRLRSGAFAQTTGELIRVQEDPAGNPSPGGYCCLGVLVDYAIESGCETVRYKEGSNRTAVEVLRNWSPDEPGSSEEWQEFTDNDLPGEVAEWAGMEGHGTDLSNPMAGDETLISLNDKTNLEFAEIADRIDSDL